MSLPNPSPSLPHSFYPLPYSSPSLTLSPPILHTTHTLPYPPPPSPLSPPIRGLGSDQLGHGNDQSRLSQPQLLETLLPENGGELVIIIPVIEIIRSDDIIQ